MKYPIGTIFRYDTDRPGDYDERRVISTTEYEILKTGTRYPLTYLIGEDIVVLKLAKEKSFDEIYLRLKNEPST